MKCAVWRKIANLANHYRNKCSVPFPEQSGSDVDECGYLRPVCRTEAKRLLLLIMTAEILHIGFDLGFAHHWPIVTIDCTRDYVEHIYSRTKFGQDRSRGYFSPCSQSYHPFSFFFLCFFAFFYPSFVLSFFLSFVRKIFPRTYRLGYWTDFDMWYTYSCRVVCFGELEHSIFTYSPSKPPKTNFGST